MDVSFLREYYLFRFIYMPKIFKGTANDFPLITVQCISTLGVIYFRQRNTWNLQLICNFKRKSKLLTAHLFIQYLSFPCPWTEFCRNEFGKIMKIFRLCESMKISSRIKTVISLMKLNVLQRDSIDRIALNLSF